MISKQTIRNTVICYWSAEDERFIAGSAMLPYVIIGIGTSKEEALVDFNEALEEMYEEIAADNLAGYKMGRPAKGYLPFNTNIRPASKAAVADLAKKMDISQGEVVDYLVFFHECKSKEEISPTKDKLVEAFQAFEAKFDQQARSIEALSQALFNPTRNMPFGAVAFGALEHRQSASQLTGAPVDPSSPTLTLLQGGNSSAALPELGQVEL